MDRHWRDVRVHVLRCQFRYYFKEIQLIKDARARLRWPAYSCAMCDFSLHINPKLMMPWILKHRKVFVCAFFFLFGLLELQTQDQYFEIGWGLQLHEYMSDIYF